MGSLSSALYSGLSGLNVNQTAMQVVGNNIANSNTTAFKASRILFSPQFYVTSSPGSPADSTFGGSNPSQVGLGAAVGSIEQDFTPGQLTATGVNTDMAINGGGFFVVDSPSGQQFTRDGAFKLNDQNQLVDSAGGFVQGYGVDPNFNIIPGNLQNLTIPLGAQTIAKATANAALQGNLNSNGQVANGASELTTQPLQVVGGGTITPTTPLSTIQTVGAATPLFTAGQTLTMNATKGNTLLTPETFNITPTTTVADLQNFFQTGLGIDSNPPAGSPGPAPGISLANAPGGGQSLVITGNVGSDNAISLAGQALSSSGGGSPFTFTDAGGASGESTTTVINAFDSLGAPVALDVNAVLVGKSNAGSSWDFYVSSPDNQGGNPIISNGTLQFDNNGKLVSQTGNAITLNRTGTGANPLQAVKLDFSGVQSLADTTSDIVSPSQDGFGVGTLNNFSIGTDGTITGSFTNGLTRVVGQVAVANFANPDGLIDNGGNLYSAGANSGNAVIAAAGQMGAGTIESSTLESSNVDLSKEFINLIVDSTGFSASSRVISTSDQLLTDLLNSQR